MSSRRVSFSTDIALAVLFLIALTRIVFGYQIDCAVGVQEACEAIAVSYRDKEQQ